MLLLLPPPLYDDSKRATFCRKLFEHWEVTAEGGAQSVCVCVLALPPFGGNKGQSLNAVIKPQPSLTATRFCKRLFLNTGWGGRLLFNFLRAVRSQLCSSELRVGGGRITN